MFYKRWKPGVHDDSELRYLRLRPASWLGDHGIALACVNYRGFELGAGYMLSFQHDGTVERCANLSRSIGIPTDRGDDDKLTLMPDDEETQYGVVEYHHEPNIYPWAYYRPGRVIWNRIQLTLKDDRDMEDNPGVVLVGYHGDRRMHMMHFKTDGHGVLICYPCPDCVFNESDIDSLSPDNLGVILPSNSAEGLVVT